MATRSSTSGKKKAAARKSPSKKRTPTKADLPTKTAAQKARAKRILDDLYKHYRDAHCELDFRNPTELLVATILSAQSTDVGVNKATPRLFKDFKTPADYAACTPQKIEKYINSIGLFRNKAKSIHAAMTMIVEDFGGKVPDTMEDLLKLRGVARKTANVVLGMPQQTLDKQRQPATYASKCHSSNLQFAFTDYVVC